MSNYFKNTYSSKQNCHDLLGDMLVEQVWKMWCNITQMKSLNFV